MGFTREQYEAVLAKQKKATLPDVSPSAVMREIPLHNEIMRWCDAQWPKVKYIRARSDQRSTIDQGAQDFTLFLPQGRLLCVEVKSKDGKLKPEQLAWLVQMELLGHKVNIVRSMDEFLATLTPAPISTTPTAVQAL